MIDKSNQRVRDMFAQIAGKYDRMNHLLSGNVDRYWRWQTVRQVPARGSAPILDLCTGTGDLAFAYHKATRGQVPIVAADFCREMLDVGQAKKHRRGIGDTIEFVEADAQHLPFASDHFQLACVAFGLRNVADTNLGLQEMMRVVQPGGRVAVLEFSTPERQPMKYAYGFYFRNVLPRIGQLLAKNDRQAYSYLPESVGQFPCGAALAQRLEAVGLCRVSFTPLTFGIATLYLGHKAPAPLASCSDSPGPLNVEQ